MAFHWRRGWIRKKIRYGSNAERRQHADSQSEAWLSRLGTESCCPRFRVPQINIRWETEEPKEGTETQLSPVYSIDVHSEAEWCLTGNFGIN